MSKKIPKVTLLAGGVGGAKIAEGLDAINNIKLSIIGNIADDDNFHGLWVSPDIDTLTYSLAKIINRDQGWGLSKESYNSLSMLSKFNQDTWMTLGDKDFGVHIYRTMRKNRGEKPSVIANDIALALGVNSKIILPTDNIVKTKVLTDTGWINFQEYFVKEKCEPIIRDLKFEGIENAIPTYDSLESIKNSEIIIFVPSNPLVSLNPIIQIPGIKEALIKSNSPKIGISPFIGNKTIKGPANKMMEELGKTPNSLGFAEIFHDILDLFVIDESDKNLCEKISRLIPQVHLTDIMMKNQKDKLRLAKETIKIANKLASN